MAFDDRSWCVCVGGFTGTRSRAIADGMEKTYCRSVWIPAAFNILGGGERMCKKRVGEEEKKMGLREDWRKRIEGKMALARKLNAVSSCRGPVSELVVEKGRQRARELLVKKSHAKVV